MKPFFPLIILSLILVGSSSALAENPKRKGWEPPGWQKKSWVPSRPDKRILPPPDVLVTNEPDTNVVVLPAPSNIEVPVYDSKRVESPRGEVLTESLPPENTVTKPGPSGESSKPAHSKEGEKLERELDSNLRQINASWLNQNNRMAVLKSIAVESGVPLQTLISQFTANNSLRGSELLMANKVAAESGEPFEDVMAAHQQNQDWLATGEKFGVSPGTLVDASKRIAAER